VNERNLSTAAALAALISGLWGAYALVGGSPGIGVPLAAIAVAITVIVGDRSIVRSPHALLFGGLALMLAGLAALRDAEWIVAIDLFAALGLASLAMWQVTTWWSLVRTSLSSAADWFLAPARVLLTLSGSVGPSRRGQLRPLMRGSIVGAFLVLVFGTLFVSADAAFARITSELLTPGFDAGLIPARVTVGVLMVGLAGGLVISRRRTLPALGSGDPFATSPSAEVKRRPRAEWIVPLALLDVLFLAFVVVQITVLFGGREHVVETAGVSYADYARSGFFQLLAVAFMTLVVIAVALRVAGPRTTYEDRWLQALLGTLCLCTVVILVLAYERLTLYEEAYGFTRLRIAVHGTILWLGAIFTLVMLAGIRMKAAWLPRACVGAAAVGLIAFTLVDPDGLVARENVERYERTGKLDVVYMTELSADALPHLLELPDEHLACIVPHFDHRLGRDEPWTSANLARSRARSLLQSTPDLDFSACGARGNPRYDFGD
jgi:hypothetical protein